MSSTSASSTGLRIALRWLAVSFLVVAATWLAVVLWWQATQRAVTTTDAVLYMLALPIAVIVCIVLIRRTFLSRELARRPKPGQSPEDTTSSDQTGEDDGKRLAPTLAIIGAWASTWLSPYGDELLEHLNARRIRPTPDASLIDEHGYPLLSGRAKELDTNSVEADLATAVAGSPDSKEELPGGARDALLRTLALLDSVLAQVSSDWPRFLTGMEATSEQHVQAVTLRGLSESSVPPAGVNLQVKLLLSDELDDLEIRSTRTYIAERLAAYGMSASHTSIETSVSDEAPVALMLAEDFRRTATTDSPSEPPQALLLLSGVSNVCPTIAATWESRELTFSSHRPNGRMPGEAAFAVLCANEKALAITSAKPMCHLAPAVLAQRKDSGKERQKDDVLSAAIHNALNAAKLTGDAIGAVVCDADHRSDRTLESIGAMVSVAPKLDAIHDRLAIEESCGHLGAASALGILAVGAINAKQAAHPVLLFNVGHPIERIAALLLPAGTAEGGTSSQYTQAA